MRKLTGLLIVGGLLAFASNAMTQPPPGGNRDGREPRGSQNADDFISQMLSFDKNNDGKLSKDEVTDTRLQRLFDRADADKDGVVTKDELTALVAKESATLGGGDRGRPRGGGPPDRGPGGPGGPGGQRGGPGGEQGGGGPDGFDGPPPPLPGEVMSPRLQESLNLTDTQRKQIAVLQKEVETRLEKILTAAQKQQLREMRDRGPGFGPPPDGARGPNGPGGPNGSPDRTGGPGRPGSESESRPRRP